METNRNIHIQKQRWDRLTHLSFPSFPFLSFPFLFFPIFSYSLSLSIGANSSAPQIDRPPVLISSSPPSGGSGKGHGSKNEHDISFTQKLRSGSITAGILIDRSISLRSPMDGQIILYILFSSLLFFSSSSLLVIPGLMRGKSSGNIKNQHQQQVSTFVPDYSSSNEDEKTGFLTKEGEKFKTWRKRWCVLKNKTIIYARSSVRNSICLSVYLSLKINRLIIYYYYYFYIEI